MSLSALSVCNKDTTVYEHVLDQKADPVFLTEIWLKGKGSAVITEMPPPHSLESAGLLIVAGQLG